LKAFTFAAVAIAALTAPVAIDGAAHAQSWTGKASFYSHGSRTASGARYDPGAMTAAHKTLPFGSRLRVTNLANQRSVLVTVNDRGPFVGGRILDLSAGAADVIGMRQSGVAQVRIDRVAGLQDSK
jgi:rare lipoprotein A